MAAISSVGTAFVTNSNSVLNTVTGIINSLSLSGISCAEIDVTNLSSTAKSFVLGTRDGGTIEVGVFVDNAGAAPDLPTSGDNAPTKFKLRFGGSSAGGPQLEFDAYIQNISVEAGIDAAVSATYTLRVTGPITIT